ncbi:sugar transferase, partial [Campylobacter jejuni]|nr:sugar transferase [Campylobacter jejuni]
MQDKLIVAARSDAFGERMLNFLNAIYLSSKVGLKFGYIWPEYFYRWSKEELLARNIIREGSDLFTEEELFSKQFIKEYSYANKLKTNEGELFIQSEGIFLKDQVYHLTEFVKDPQYSWGWSSTQFDLSILFPEIDTREYHSELRKIWQKLTLDFCDDAKDSLRFAMHVSNQLGDNFISIHLRSGGFVYDDRMVARFGVRKAVPIHLVLDVIQQKNKDYSIVIFGDDLDSIRQLKEYCFFSLNLSNIFIVDDFTNHNFSRKQQTLFELILLSMSLEIYTSGRSGFSNLA